MFILHVSIYAISIFESLSTSKAEIGSALVASHVLTRIFMFDWGATVRIGTSSEYHLSFFFLHIEFFWGYDFAFWNEKFFKLVIIEFAISIECCTVQIIAMRFMLFQLVIFGSTKETIRIFKAPSFAAWLTFVLLLPLKKEPCRTVRCPTTLNWRIVLAGCELYHSLLQQRFKLALEWLAQDLHLYKFALFSWWTFDSA